VWHHAAAPVALKKRLPRTALPEMLMAHTAEPPEERWPRHWQGGGQTELRGARTTPGKPRRATAPQGLELS
jgi:hypothetical protein